MLRLFTQVRWFLLWLGLAAALAALVRLHPAASAGGPTSAAPMLHGASSLAWLCCSPFIFILRVIIGPQAYASGLLQFVAALISSGLLVLCVHRFVAMRRSLAGGSSSPNVAGTRVGLSRRRFIADGVAVAVIAPPVATLAHAAIIAPWQLRIERHRVPIRDLPAAFDGIRLVQISDTHLGRFVPATFIAEVVEQAIALRPDVVLMTGDYVFGGTEHIDPAAAGLRPLAERLSGIPLLAVLGNHDWYADAPRMRRALESIGVRMLDNARVYLDAASRRVSDRFEGAPALCFAGVGDFWTDRVDLAAALEGVPEDVPRVLLSHNPDVAETLVPISGRRVDLMLSGHTHGGQVNLPLIGARFAPSRYGAKYAGGLVQGPACPVVISRGIGMSIAPVRFRVPPEIVEITLVRDRE